jgi:2'-5' RNA ligase
MYYVLLIYPDSVDQALAGRIRRQYDPTVDVIAPHVPVVYPLPGGVGRDLLISHVRNVALGCTPFEIRLGALHRSADHWLFLTPVDGNEDLRRLHLRLHTGLLAEFRATDRDYVPHVGLGLFLRAGATYDWENPREEDFDAERYEAAVREAQPLLDGPAERIDTLHLVTIPDAVVEWFSGERSTFPRDSRADEVCAFTFGA